MQGAIQKNIGNNYICNYFFSLKGKARRGKLRPRGHETAIGRKQRRGQRRGHSTAQQGHDRRLGLPEGIEETPNG